MDDSSATLRRLGDQVAAFATERDWLQFHTPKNLAMALAGEAGELLAEFQWLTPEESLLLSDGSRRSAVAQEMADVFIYLLRMSDVLSIDLVAAVEQKLATNAENYPVELSYGRSDRPETGGATS